MSDEKVVGRVEVVDGYCILTAREVAHQVEQERLVLGPDKPSRVFSLARSHEELRWHRDAEIARLEAENQQLREMFILSDDELKQRRNEVKVLEKEKRETTDAEIILLRRVVKQRTARVKELEEALDPFVEAGGAFRGNLWVDSDGLELRLKRPGTIADCTVGDLRRAAKARKG